MKWWMKKITVVLVTILTLGLYVPPIYLDADINDTDKGEFSPDDNVLNENTSQVEVEYVEESSIVDSNEELYLEVLTDQAKYQIMEKLGQRIADRMDEELDTIVMPNLELVLNQMYEDFGLERSQYLVVAENPASGYGERIFNLYDVKEKSDIATFHVKQVKRPKEGYYFQFHYHLAKDNFEEHYTIADIYWGKNTPPKWMT
ncbi:YpjP family protein [Gracilibacillus marinus]|jgi:hypothetical protein|uniref:YpjP family protein n=1 Tax=Gracilibacillus marinus TaxID=630535 RepID=A0ABV8VTB0_9BACI